MKFYVDSSVLLRLVLNEPHPIRELVKAKRVISSAIIRLECLRTLDRARIRNLLSEKDVASRRYELLKRLDAFDMVPLVGKIFERAEENFPTLLGSLDAIHLASALAARVKCQDLVFATHDVELGVAAQAMGFEVIK